VSGTHRAGRQLLREQGEQIGAVDADVCSRAGELMWLVVGARAVGYSNSAGVRSGLTGRPYAYSPRVSDRVR
jgi:hypothetical protein